MVGQTAVAEVTTVPVGAVKGILIYGTIEKGDANKFATYAGDMARHPTGFLDYVNGTPYILVELNSTGGDVKEAIEIGRLVRREFMITFVAAEMECDSACVLVLIAGVDRTIYGKVGLHRPTFDRKFFAGLPERAAYDQYNTMIRELKEYYINEMGGSPEAFREMLNIPSTSIRYLTSDEAYDLGLIGKDPAFAEHSDAQWIERLGREGYAAFQKCLALGGDMLKACVQDVFHRYGS